MRSNTITLPRRAVLLAHEGCAITPSWVDEMATALEPAGMFVRQAYSHQETVRCVERGGLAAAVLVTGGRRIDGISILRIIRSIDSVLPCWIVAERTDRAMLQAALSLRVTSVIAQPAKVVDITRALRRVIGPL